MVETLNIGSYSIYADSELEAAAYKWIVSQRAGKDMGDDAIREWVKLHWWGFLRARWIEHLQGKRFFQELGKNDFGLLLREFHDIRPLLDELLELLKKGGENLTIINWAIDSCKPMEDVHRILEALDMNSRRLKCQFACAAHLT